MEYFYKSYCHLLESTPKYKDKKEFPIHARLQLGIPNLHVMGWASQMRWLWLNKGEDNRPWKGLDIPIQPQVRAMFAISVVTQVGNGRNTLVWTDGWLQRCSLMDLAPAVVACLPKRVT